MSASAPQQVTALKVNKNPNPLNDKRTDPLDAMPIPTAADKAAKAPKAAKEKTPKAPKTPRVSTLHKAYPDTAKVTILTEGKVNPKRKDSKAHARFAMYKDGATVGDFIKAGGTYADLSWDVGHGFISVT